MYCILVAGMPASGKSTIAGSISESLGIPMLSKDSIKEVLFDDLGFHSRAEKVQLGTAAMHILYYAAAQLMKVGKPFTRACKQCLLLCGFQFAQLIVPYPVYATCVLFCFTPE